VNPKTTHFAFAASGMSEFAERLRKLYVAHTFRAVPDTEIVQVVLLDPDGNVLKFCSITPAWMIRSLIAGMIRCLSGALWPW
jgi:hypothetical protein